MKRAVGSPFRYALCFFIVFSSPVLAKSEKNPLDYRPPLRLAEPDWRPLTAQRIREKISGRSVIIDDTYETLPGERLPTIFRGGCAPRETFFQDGRWQMGVCQRAYRVFTGSWSIEPFRGGEWLCVGGDQYPKSCRFVWQGPTDDLIFMAFGTPPTESQLNDDFMPYRIQSPADRVPVDVNG